MSESIATSPSTSFDTTLSTGLRFVGERIERSQGVAVAIRIPAGSKDDPGNKFGLANLVKETLFKGTKKRDARAISDAFDFYGIRHSEYTGTESTGLQLRFLPEHLEQVFKLLREVLSQPSFPEKECETAKVQAIQELKHLDDDPFSKVFVVLKELYFGAEWGHPDLGSETSIPEISRSDIQGFWKGHFLPAGTIAERLAMPPSSLTFHLQQMRHAGLVTQRRVGRQIIYAADFAAMNDLVAYLTQNCCGRDAACGPVCNPAPAAAPAPRASRQRRSA